MDVKQFFIIQTDTNTFQWYFTVYHFSCHALAVSELFYNALSVLTKCERTFTSHW